MGATLAFQVNMRMWSQHGEIPEIKITGGCLVSVVQRKWTVGYKRKAKGSCLSITEGTKRTLFFVTMNGSSQPCGLKTLGDCFRWEISLDKAFSLLTLGLDSNKNIFAFKYIYFYFICNLLFLPSLLAISLNVCALLINLFLCLL